MSRMRFCTGIHQVFRGFIDSDEWSDEASQGPQGYFPLRGVRLSGGFCVQALSGLCKVSQN